jgi:hypothetical protein
VCSLPLLTVPSGTGVVLLPLHLAWSTTEVEEAYPPYQPVILRSEGALTYSCVAPPPVEPYPSEQVGVPLPSLTAHPRWSSCLTVRGCNFNLW